MNWWWRIGCGKISNSWNGKEWSEFLIHQQCEWWWVWNFSRLTVRESCVIFIQIWMRIVKFIRQWSKRDCRQKTWTEAEVFGTTPKKGERLETNWSPFEDNNDCKRIQTFIATFWFPKRMLCLVCKVWLQYSIFNIREEQQQHKGKVHHKKPS